VYVIKHLYEDKYIDENGEFSDIEFAHHFASQDDTTKYIYHTGWEIPVTVYELERVTRVVD